MGYSIIKFPEAVRERPGMYIGDLKYKGISNMISYVIQESLACFKKPEHLYEITINSDLALDIWIHSDESIDLLKNLITTNDYHNYGMYLAVFRSLSQSFSVSGGGYVDSFRDGTYLETNCNDEQCGLLITSELDKNIFRDSAIFYDHLIEQLSQIAMLYKGVEIVVKDVRGKYLRQEYYHYPTGIKHLFDRICKEQRSYWNFYYERQEHGNNYNIGLSFTKYWANEPTIFSYADDIKTIEHGSLVDGILSGIVAASKEIVGRENHDYDFSIRRLKRHKNLVLVTSVRGDGSGFKYYGSVKNKLNSPQVRKDAKQICHQMCIEYMKENLEKSIQTIDWIFRKVWPE